MMYSHFEAEATSVRHRAIEQRKILPPKVVMHAPDLARRNIRPVGILRAERYHAVVGEALAVGTDHRHLGEERPARVDAVRCPGHCSCVHLQALDNGLRRTAKRSRRGAVSGLRREAAWRSGARRCGSGARRCVGDCAFHQHFEEQL
eukprot:scaffold11187_cov30-Tisochrysis_lutea.AAC.13